MRDFAVPDARLRAHLPLGQEVAEDQGPADHHEGDGYDRDHDGLHRLGVEGALDPLQGRHAQKPCREAPEPEEDRYLEVDGLLAVVLQRARELGHGGEDHVRPDRRRGRDAHYGE